jgi:hypothetical protein
MHNFIYDSFKISSKVILYQNCIIKSENSENFRLEENFFFIFKEKKSTIIDWLGL